MSRLFLVSDESPLQLILPIFNIGGDWNVPLNYSMDTLNYIHKNNEKAQKQIHFMMEQLDLVDSFRELNPDIKRYTWRGHVA
jgi:exonuclease III